MNPFLGVRNGSGVGGGILNLRREKSLVVITHFGVTSNKRNVATCIVANRLKEGVYGVEKGIACSV